MFPDLPKVKQRNYSTVIIPKCSKSCFTSHFGLMKCLAVSSHREGNREIERDRTPYRIAGIIKTQENSQKRKLEIKRASLQFAWQPCCLSLIARFIEIP